MPIFFALDMTSLAFHQNLRFFYGVDTTRLRKTETEVETIAEDKPIMTEAYTYEHYFCEGICIDRFLPITATDSRAKDKLLLGKISYF